MAPPSQAQKNLKACLKNAHTKADRDACEATYAQESGEKPDGGKVFDRWEQWNFHRTQSDVGFGLRFKMRTRVVFSFDNGFSHEGFQIWFRVNNLL